MMKLKSEEMQFLKRMKQKNGMREGEAYKAVGNTIKGLTKKRPAKPKKDFKEEFEALKRGER